MSRFEIIAAALGIISVYLSTRQNVLAWPTSLVNNVMYFVIFSNERLVGLMGLQAFFGGIAIYGWYKWLLGKGTKSELKVSRIPSSIALVLLLLSVLGTVGLFCLFRYYKDPAPFVDALLTSMSLLAQWMMARKYFECWPVWVAINCVSAPFFLVRGNYPTMAQYAVFLVLAVMGTRNWWMSMKQSASSSEA